MPPKRNQKKGASSQASRNASKTTSKVPSRQDTPTIPGTPANEAAAPKYEGQTVVGINFGQTASSIAVINKEGLADCIANDDGDRQIATAVSFAGDQVYVGNPARQQLVRNNENTVLAFRDLIGKTYDEVKSLPPRFNSARLVSKDGQPAYSLSISSSESDSPTSQTLTVSEISTIYLRTLISYASDYLGRPITCAVYSVPSSWTDSQRTALAEINEKSLGVKVLQFVDEAGATVVAYGLTGGKDAPKAPTVATSTANTTPSSAAAAQTRKQDSNVVVLDVGGTSTTATVLAARGGFYIELGHAHNPRNGGHDLDSRLIEHFAKEFTKKTKLPLSIPSADSSTKDVSQHRAGMKLRLAAEVTKKSLSASTTANCSVESLSEGTDFSGNLNRMRFDLLSGKVYGEVVKTVEEAVKKSGLTNEQIDEVILIGGTTKMPAIADKISPLFPPSTLLTSSLEPDEAVAMGCALHARSVVDAYPHPDPSSGSAVSEDFEKAAKGEKALEVGTLSKPLGIVVSLSSLSSKSESLVESAVNGKVFLTLAARSTVLPFHRSFELPLSASSAKGGKVALDLWQGVDEVRVEEVAARPNGTKKADDSEDEDSEDEEEPKRTAIVRPTNVVAHLDLTKLVEGGKGKAATVVLKVDEEGKGSWSARVGDAAEVKAGF